MTTIRLPATTTTRESTSVRRDLVTSFSTAKSHFPFGAQDEQAALPAAAAAAAGDDSIGYDRFRCSDDCGHERCSYRGTMTHYHCRRSDCGYSFCDRARYPSHADRHRRVDAIAGDLFVQCHAKAPCTWVPSGDCPLAARGATHYHCRLCPAFVCTDATKIASHRKQHARLDRVAAGEFRRFEVGEDCGDEACTSRTGRVPHYHCTRPGCRQVVIGTTQMAIHRAYHAGGASTVVGGSVAGSASTLFQPLASLTSLVQLPVLSPSATV
jgi:hypothetical protein